MRTALDRRWLASLRRRAWPVPVALAGLVVLLAATVVQQDPVVLQELRNRGKAHYEEKQYTDAVEAFARVVRSDEATVQDCLNLALAHYRNGDDGAAMAAMEATGPEAAGRPGFAYLRGLVAKRSGRLEEARDALERAREADPTDPAIRYNLGAVYSQLGREAQAQEEFEAVIDMGFDVALQHYVSSLYRHFQSLLRQGLRDRARPEIEEHRRVSQRLSEAARSPSALEESRYARVGVPDLSLVGPAPETADAVSFGRRRTVGVVEGAISGWEVADLNADGVPDLVFTGDRPGAWLSDGEGYRHRSVDLPPGPVAAGDFDRDGRPDLYVADVGGDALFRNVVGDDGVDFVRVAAQGLPAGGAPTSVLWVDHDHDGDLDVLVGHGRDPQDGPVADRLLRNQGGGAFEDVSDAAGLGGPSVNRGSLWADLDRDHDVDLLLWDADGVRLLGNQRGGRFREIASAVGVDGPPGIVDAAAEDLDNDGHLDLVLATAGAVVVLSNNGDGTFLEAGHGADTLAMGDSGRLLVADWNNDGHLDLGMAGEAGVRLVVNAGEMVFRPLDTSESEPVRAGPAAVADADGDGAVDLLTAGPDGGLAWALQPVPVASWLGVDLTGIKNNLRGVGAMVEVKAGGLYQLRPLRRTPLHFGLGEATAADVVRIRWPNGIIQNLLDVGTGQVVTATELERLEGSCPFLYTWDGSQWRFANEVLGVAPLGMPLAEGVFHVPDPDEYVPVPGEALRSRDGVLEIRLTEELREAGYVDAARLLAVDHPVGTRVLPEERFASPPHPRFRLHVVERTLPVRAVDQNGRGWTDELGEVDETWAVPFEPGRYDGLATPHSLELTLPAAAGSDAPVRLLLTGWVYWATGSSNLAADQDPRVDFEPVRLEVPDGRGGWRLAAEDIGLPNAKNSTLVLDIGEWLDRADPRVRLSTTMRLYWDAARYVMGGPQPQGITPRGDWQRQHGVPSAGELDLGDAPVRVQVLAPASADLRPRGFSRLQRSADGYETFDYQRVVETAPWDQHPGHYTRFGPVGELLDDADDRYVILGTGDELAIRFPADLPPVRPGWQRDWLVYLNGWVKDGDPNTAWGDRVGPLPFHGMSAYPFAPEDAYPDDVDHRRFLEEWVTRPARRINPALHPDPGTR